MGASACGGARAAIFGRVAPHGQYAKAASARRAGEAHRAFVAAGFHPWRGGVRRGGQCGACARPGIFQ
eukprot:1321054-Prymnesium_polylepis.1